MSIDTNVPVWIVAGMVAAGGWLYERTTESGDDVVMNRVGLEVLDQKVTNLQEQLGETKESLKRVEDYIVIILEKSDD